MGRERALAGTVCPTGGLDSNSQALWVMSHEGSRRTIKLQANNSWRRPTQQIQIQLCIDLPPRRVAQSITRPSCVHIVLRQSLELPSASLVAFYRPVSGPHCLLCSPPVVPENRSRRRRFTTPVPALSPDALNVLYRPYGPISIDRSDQAMVHHMSTRHRHSGWLSKSHYDHELSPLSVAANHF